jgi:hypothetical protein
MSAALNEQENDFLEFANRLWEENGVIGTVVHAITELMGSLVASAKAGCITWIGAKLRFMVEFVRLNDEALMAFCPSAADFAEYGQMCASTFH